MRPRSTIVRLLFAAARTARLLLGTFWAAGILAIGLVCWQWHWPVTEAIARHARGGEAAASRIVTLVIIGCIAGGQFVFIRLVANDICPRRPAMLSVFVESLAGALVVLCIASLAWLGWRAIA